LKIVEIEIMSLVFLLRWSWDAHAYYLPHRVGNTMPNSTEMSDYECTFVDSPMLGETQFCVPKNNLHHIRRNTLTSELKKKKPRAGRNKCQLYTSISMQPSSILCLQWVKGLVSFKF
jgi:hypothetical protein